MRRQRDVIGLGHRGDLHALRDAAGMRQVRLHDGETTCSKTRLNSKREYMRSPAASGTAVWAARRG